MPHIAFLRNGDLIVKKFYIIIQSRKEKRRSHGMELNLIHALILTQFESTLTNLDFDTLIA